MDTTFSQDAYSPDPGMTNALWARKLLLQLSTLPSETLKETLLSRALDYACLWSERLGDAMAKHVLKGHTVISGPAARPGWFSATCEECEFSVELEKGTNSALFAVLRPPKEIPA